MGVAVPTCVATIPTPYRPDRLATVTYVAAWLGVAVGLGALTISALWHRGLCEACITEVPLDAPRLGARYRRQFAVIHTLTRTRTRVDRKSTRLNSSHVRISYAVFCLKQKTA